jgi:bifunctional NMN adenylyltransferase/nudix hydrolase
LAKAKHVLVLVGSSGSARTIRNPFTFAERREMIVGAYGEEIASHLIVKPLYDKTYNDAAWIKQVQDVVKETVLDVVNAGGFKVSGTSDARIGLIGMAKDHTSYYLKMFPQFESVDVPLSRVMHATALRTGFFNNTMHKYEVAVGLIPMNVANFMYDEFAHTPVYEQLRDELEHVTAYKESWRAAPYPVKHATVDAVVEQSGHILLVKRRAEPGKGLWAIPGGHLNEFETQIDGALRELREETKLKVPDAVLRGSLVANRTFDEPYRSTLGRVITQAYHFKLADATTLPKVKGSDDAIKAMWVPISELREDLLFDDHFFIISWFLGI